MKTLRIAAVAVLAGLVFGSQPASATMCSVDFRIGGPDALRDYQYGVQLTRAQRVEFQYFGRITEIQLYKGGLLYYRGAPISSFNAPDSFSLLVLKGNPGDVVRITTDWPYPPNGCR